MKAQWSLYQHYNKSLFRSKMPTLFIHWGWWGSTGYCAVKVKQARRKRASRQYTPQGAVDTTCHQGVLLHQQPFVCTLTWGHSCFALWIWETARQGVLPPAHTAPEWCLQWSWTCQTWPGRTQGVSWFYLHHLERVKVAVRRKLYRRGNQKGLLALSCTCLSFSSPHSYSLHNWEIKHARFNCPHSLWSPSFASYLCKVQTLWSSCSSWICL